MMFWTHLAFALFFYCLIVQISGTSFSFAIALVLCLGALLPDIDSPSSFLGKHVRIGITKHRGFLHSIFGILIFSLAAVLFFTFFKISQIYTIALAAGCFLHLSADSLTPSGIRWLWQGGHIKGFIRTGSLGETIIFVLLCIGCILFLIT